jgi:Uma2 family endonuclease
MSTVQIPLVAGQRLDRATFHELYETMPPGTRAELIGGIVHRPGPVDREHARATGKVVTWLGLYERQTPGVEVLDGATTALDDLGEPEPDALLRILPEWGGQTRDEGSIIAGPPELVVEVARATRFIDLGPKRADYERAGVLEYVVRALEPDEVLWHTWHEGRLTIVPPGPDGLYRSLVFPGLWLDSAALLANDLDGLDATLDRGLASPEHAEFVAHLAGKRGSAPP